MGSLSSAVRETARNVLGVLSGWRKVDEKTWWWNKNVQDRVKGKKLAKRN